MKTHTTTVTTCEVVWLKCILKELGVLIKDPIPLHCNNMSNIYLVRNLVFHAWTKHIEVHYHFIRERVQAGDIDLQHSSTHLQVADIVTKALGINKLRHFVSNLGLSLLDQPNLRGSTQPKSRTIEVRSVPETDIQKFCLKGRVEN